jgi:hypothetical protein
MKMPDRSRSGVIYVPESGTDPLPIMKSTVVWRLIMKSPPGGMHFHLLPRRTGDPRLVQWRRNAEAVDRLGETHRRLVENS